MKIIKSITDYWDRKTDAEKNRVIIIIGILILTIFFGYQLYNHYLKAKQKVEDSFKTSVLKDENKYFMVLSSANKYVNYVTSSSKDILINILEPEYVKKNNITINNIDNYLPKIGNDYMYDYVVDEIYAKTISKNVTEYYLYGKIRRDNDDVYTYIDYPLTVILYADKVVYSIRPGGEQDGR